MPRDGSGIYHRPVGTDAVPDTTVESSKYNINVADVEQDLNTPRPIIAGGTGANSAINAMTNLGGEIAKQIVTNYDTQAWQPGSFYSSAGATSAPVAGHAFAGIVYLSDNNNVIIEARDFNDTIQPSRRWVRMKNAGTWTNWSMRELTTISDNAPPSNPVVGQLWYDNSHGQLYIWYDDGSSAQWVVVAPNAGGGGTSGGGGGGTTIVMSDTPPAGAVAGTLWFNTTNGQLYIRYNDPDSTQWVAVNQAQTATINAILFDQPQPLTQDQQNLALANIGATVKNYIVNGAMQIAQEWGATTSTISGFYAADQFAFTFVHGGTTTMANVASPTPSGATNRIRYTVTAADASVAAGDNVLIFQRLEGQRIADLRFGSAAAKTVTLRFGCKGPAGTYCIAFRNGAVNRIYVAEYTIAAGEANTDVVKTVTVPGDVTGTWATDNTTGMEILWGLMAGTSFQTTANAWTAGGNLFATSNQFNIMGTNGNVFELFDVALYQGSVAQEFVVPDPARELLLCQRYWQVLSYITLGSYAPAAASANYYWIPTKVTMRTGPAANSKTAPSLTNVSSYTIPFANAEGARVDVTATAIGNFNVTNGVISMNARM